MQKTGDNIMKKNKKIILIPIIGYFGLWILGSIFFVIYFKIFKVSMKLNNTAMIIGIPPLLSIFTVPICSFASFFLTTKIVLKNYTGKIALVKLFRIGIISLIFTIGLDLLITVVTQKVDILIFPINVMYILAWIIIIPTIILAGYQKTKNNQ